MKVYANQLAAQLNKGLAPVYLISGDEPLQLAECGDAIRAAARAQGYTGREVMHVERGFDWSELSTQASTLSLFAERRILELRFATAKPGVDGAKALTEYCARAAPDDLLLITMPKLESEATRSKWYAALDQAGVVVQVWPVEIAQLPGWIEQRMKRAGLQPGPEVVAMLAARVEGNLLAAAQEIEKLRLLHGEGRIEAEQLRAAVSDSARYDVFGLVDAALQGEAARVARILDGLRGEGEDPILVLWALAREIRALVGMAHAAHTGATVEAAMAAARVWDKRKPLVRQALARHSYPRWLMLHRRAALIDQMIKGQAAGNAWDELLQLAELMAGVRLLRAVAG